MQSPGAHASLGSLPPPPSPHPLPPQVCSQAGAGPGPQLHSSGPAGRGGEEGLGAERSGPHPPRGALPSHADRLFVSPGPPLNDKKVGGRQGIR